MGMPMLGGGSGSSSSGGATQHNRCFVGGLSDSVSDEQLKDHFAQFCEVTDCYIPKEKSGKQRGYGCAVIARVFGVASERARLGCDLFLLVCFSLVVSLRRVAARTTNECVCPSQLCPLVN